MIRPLAPADRPAWEPLWRDYLAFYGTTLPPEVYDAQWQRLMTGHPVAGLIAEKDGLAIGITHFIFHSHGWKTRDVCYLQDLYVTPDARGTGAGRALIEGVYAAADANGTPDVYWLTAQDNAPGRRLYDRVGSLTPFIKYARP
ncbi:Acetyltransferase (GNAT) family protein [Rhodobacteraceae bacterium THAF1]|uniref:GNAT family N-acetyltransferase n=1 Tax=Palleronia sp. THAF1 TaxID=2587842 RepID=UPI000F3DE462|nr:GNAT family N-acetyltransferase [Palleronia sp. THAF1]QFU08631.1 Acetyltransferase (GNAT) family protein [Palleronia sp. THAF1]VDC30758.1 Acetyltransferase (GNAT) family protein [Rhodobacteraceae bacterium THAF1]